jgi:ribokinase
VLVCALGDLTLDVIVRLAGPLPRAGDVSADIDLAPGGQAANVAAWCAELGAKARFLGKRGADEAGRLAGTGLEERGVEVLGPTEGRNGIVCSLVSPDGERSLAADRGAAAELRPEELDPAWVEGCEHLFVSGYALLRSPARDAALRAVELAREDNASVSVDLASWSGIRDVGPRAFRQLLQRLDPGIVFCNEKEDSAVGGRLDGVRWILKRGHNGCSFEGDERPALPVERVIDSTGAGDALAAGWIVGGVELALEAAARCVQRLGTMP